MSLKAEKNLQEALELQRRKVDVDSFDVTVRELMRMAAEGELERAPSYQRRFRWSEEDESVLIESVLLGLPIPSLFVATNPNGHWELIDGLQRVSTLMHFVADPPAMLKLVDKSGPLRLCGLEERKLPLFNGLTMADLPTPIQLAFMKRPFRVTALSDKSDVDVRFDMFERLNTGGIALTPQEVRACVFRGAFSDFLKELADYDSFKSLLKLQAEKQQDGTREELVLKFFAYLYDREAFKGLVTVFLNDYMKKTKHAFAYQKNRDLFHGVSDRLLEICAGPILRKNYAVSPINQVEAILVGAAELKLEGKAIALPTKDWLNDPELVEKSTKGTNTPSMLNGRIERARILLSGGKRSRKR